MIVDILLPCYGGFEYIQQSIRSILGQSSSAWRLVIVDDSPLPEAQRIEEWVRSLHDDRIFYTHNETNLGVNGNFRKCLTFVENELVTVMGADDIMMPNYIQWLIESAQKHPDVSIFQPGVEVIDAGGNPSNTLVEKVKAACRPKHEVTLSAESLALSLLRGNWLYFPSLGWRADMMLKHGFREGLEVILDLALVMDILLDGGALHYDPTLAFKYRRHAQAYSSQSAVDGSRFEEEYSFFSNLSTRFKAIGWPNAAITSKLHLYSRLHIVTMLPGSLLNKRWADAKTLVEYIVKW